MLRGRTGSLLRMQPVRVVARRALAPVRRRRAHRLAALPASGYTPSAQSVPNLDRLSDSQLAELNSILDWNCFTVDSRGRRFGDRAWAGKREGPQPIPDRRIEFLDDSVGLAGRSVVEVGCFEGVHTIALAQRAERVIAVDARVENVVKTIVRCAFYDCHPTAFVLDLEKESGDPRLAGDVLHHVGVLYHLEDPVRHLVELLPRISTAVLLDTHVATDEDPLERYDWEGRSVRYRRYSEPGAPDRPRTAPTDVFDGVVPYAKWLYVDDLMELLRELGFGDIEELEHRDERNGTRVALLARR